MTVLPENRRGVWENGLVKLEGWETYTVCQVGSLMVIVIVME